MKQPDAFPPITSSRTSPLAPAYLPVPPVEAFFTTDLTLSLAAILAQYRKRWAIEITISDSNMFVGFGHDQCCKRERVVGANTVRLVLAATCTLWFVAHVARRPALELERYRPWYRHKVAPSQLDIVWTWREALQAAGVFPIPRFAHAPGKNQPEADNILLLAAERCETNAYSPHHRIATKANLNVKFLAIVSLQYP